MKHTDLVDFFASNDMLFTTKLLKQHWKQDIYSYASSPRPDYGLLLLTHGKIKFTTQNGILNAHAGDVIFLPKYSQYQAIIEKEADNYLVNFDTAGKDFIISTPTKILKASPLNCIDCFTELIHEKTSGNPTSLKLRGLFYLLVDTIINCAESQKSLKSETIEKAMQFLRSSTEFKISDIAYQCGISTSGLRKIFKDNVGISMSEYRLQFKLNKAKYLLESTNLPIKEIADTLNFYDAAYFCKVFKKYTGMSPKQFTKNKQI